MRIDPPVSVPIVPKAERAVSATPEPMLLPPGKRLRSQGVRVGGSLPPQENSWQRVLPIKTAPAA